MAFSGNGSGSEHDPYQITTLAQLWEMFAEPDAHYILKNNIDASDTSTGANTEPWNGEAGWVPPDNHEFTGELDGDGHQITGLFCNTSKALTIQNGLFCYLAGSVKNVKFEWSVQLADDNTARHFGGVCWQTNGSATFSNVEVELQAQGKRITFLGGIAASFNGNDVAVVVENCKLNLHIDLEASTYNSTIGGVTTNPNTRSESAVTVQDTIVQLNINAPESIITNSGGVFGSVNGSNTRDAEIEIRRCKLNVVINSRGNSLGGVIGRYSPQSTSGLPTNPLFIKECWVVGSITGSHTLGGFVGDMRGVIIEDSWSDVNLYAIHEDNVSSGLIGGILPGEGGPFRHCQVFRTMSYGTLFIIHKPTASYSADIFYRAQNMGDSAYYNSDNNLDLDEEESNKTIFSTGLTTTQLKDSSYLDSESDLDFVEVWQSGGYDGYMDLQENPFDSNIIIYEGAAPILISATAMHESVSLMRLSGEYFGVDESDITEKGFEWSLNSLDDEATVTLFTSFEHEVAIEERDNMQFQAYILYEGVKYYSPVGNYTHYALQQLAVDAIIVEDYIPPMSFSRGIHGSVLVKIDNEEYIFGSPRSSIILGLPTYPEPANADIVKYKADNYSISDSVTIEDSNGYGLSQFNQISYAKGYLWTYGQVMYSDYPRTRYLCRIDPNTLDYVLFNTLYSNTDSHGNDGDYLYVRSGGLVRKINLNELTGVYESPYGNTMPPEAVVAEYDDSLQGYYLDERSPEGFTSATKGDVHSYVVDGEYLYLNYSSGSGFDVNKESRCEVHKVRLSDMTPAGWSRIPPCTDDMTQNNEFLFLGIEISTKLPSGGGDPEFMGYDWGAIAIRKSDMQLYAIPRLHETDSQGRDSYASMVFGNYLVDQKTNRHTYIIDISDVENSWSEIDQFAEPGAWILNGYVSTNLIKVLQLYQSEGTLISQIPNEILLDSQEKFHSFGWPGEFGSGAGPSSLFRYVIPGLSFIGAPIVTTVYPILQEGSLYLTGVVVNENGSPVEAVGFDYSTNPDFSNSTTLTASLGNYTATISNIESGTYYIRAWADNSEGRGYGNSVSIVIGPDPEPIEVEAPAPEWTDYVEGGGEWSTESVEGVEYNPANGVAQPGETVTVTAHALEGYQIIGDTEWTHTFPEEPDPSPSPSPSPVDPTCPERMTPLEMHIAFHRQTGHRGLAEDVDYYLNMAQDELVRGLYSGRNRRGAGFEQSQELMDDIEKILLLPVQQECQYSPQASYGSYKADYCALPKDRLFLVNYRASIWYKRGGIVSELSAGKRIPQGYTEPSEEFPQRNFLVRISQSDDIYRLLDDPYNTTYYREPLAQEIQESLVVFTDNTFIVDKVYISYIKRPRKILRGKTTTEDKICELPGILHKEVVQMAVQMYLNSKQQTDQNTR